MASSNRHWPSMFRSKPACTQPWQNQQPDMINSSPSHKSPFSSGCEERSPEPKPRWNPKPEQIRILEAIFNSGMVNPPRDEIRRIRLQLQEYGQVGDANVFYWFQNRKSRSKNKLRGGGGGGGRTAVTRAGAPSAAAPVTPPPLAAPAAPTSSSSSSSDRSSGSSKQARAAAPAAAAALGVAPATAAIDLLSPAAGQMYYHGQSAMAPEFAAAAEPFVLQGPQGYYLSAAELAGIVGATETMHAPAEHSPGAFLGLCSDLFEQDGAHRSCAKARTEAAHHGLGQWCTELMVGQEGCKGSGATSTVTCREVEEEKAKLGLLNYAFGVTATASAATTTLPLTSMDAAAASVATAGVVNSTAVPSSGSASAVTELQGHNDFLGHGFRFQDVAVLGAGLWDAGPFSGMPAVAAGAAAGGAAVVFIGDFQYVNVPAVHLNVRLFGESALGLFRVSGEPVLVDEFGVTVEPLQQGAIYYVV